MTQRGTIAAKLTLDRKLYSAGLKDALAEAKAFRAELDKLIGAPLAVPKLPPAPSLPSTSGGGRGGDAELKAQREAVRLATAAFADYQLQLRTGTKTQGQFLKDAYDLEASLRAQRGALDESSKGYGLYTAALNRVRSAIGQVEVAQVKATSATTKAASTQERVNQALRLDQVRQYREELSRLNRVYEKDRDRKAYTRDVTALEQEMERFRLTLPKASREVGQLDRVLGQSTRNLNTVQGKLSGLGISQQIAIGVNAQLASSLANTGGIAGGAASLGIAAYGTSLTGISTGSALAGGAVLGLGVAAEALRRRGVPEVQALDKAFNVLRTNGVESMSQLQGELRALQQEAGRAGQTFSRSELATALAGLVKAGLGVDEALTLLRSSVKLASAENQDLADSSALVLTNLRQFGEGAGQAATFGDQLAQAGNLAAGSVNDLSTGLSVVGPLAKASGLSLAETLDILTRLDNSGLSAATKGADGFRTVLATLADPSEKAKETLKGLGISLEDASGKTRGARVLFDELITALRGSGDATADAAKIFDTAGVTAILALTGSTEDYTQAIQNSNGALTTFAENMAEGSEAAPLRAKKAIDDLAGSFATLFAPATIAAANAINGFVRQLDLLSGNVAEGGAYDALIQNMNDYRDGLDVTSEAQRTAASNQLSTQKETLTKLLELQNAYIATVEARVLDFADDPFIKQLFGFGKANVDLSTLETARAEASRLQEQLNTIDTTISTVGQKGFRGKPGGPNIPAGLEPIDDSVADAYATSLAAAQNRAAQAELAAIQDSRARIARERQLDLQAAKTAFDESVAGLETGSKRYNQLLRLYRQETAAINTQADQQTAAAAAQANTQLEADAQTKLRTAQTLRERIEKVSTDLQDAQAKGINDPIKAITGQFQATSRAIKGETDDLLSGVQDALASGAVSAEDAQGLVAQINADARGREVKAEQDKNAAITKVQQERKAAAVKLAEETAKAVQEVLGAQAKALSDATLASIEGTIPQLQAAFKAERDERAANFEATLTAFKGSNSERIKAVKDYNSTETLLSRKHQQELNAQEKQGLQTYLQTLRDYQQQVAQAQQQARAQELQNAQALNSARVASAQNRVDSGDVSGYSALIAAQRDAVAVAKQLTQAERERGASTAEVLTALSAEAEAQRTVVSAIKAQREALISLRDEQLETINSVSSVLEYARAASELSGRKLDERDAGAAIRAQVQAQFDLYEASIAANKPLADRLEALKVIQASEKELADLGQASALNSNQKRFISNDAETSLARYPGEAADALTQIQALDAQISQLGVTLQDATGELGTLLEAAGDGEGLSLKVAVELDRSALDAAQQTLKEAFGERAGAEIIKASENAGTRAGRGLIGAFTTGIRTNQAGLLSEVDRLLQQVRNRLPSSDAKTGPLSDLTYSGGKLVTTFAGGMTAKRAHMVSAANLIASAAKPAVTVPSIPTSRAIAGMGAGAMGASGVVNNYNTHINNQPTPTTGILAGDVRQLMNTAEREAKLRGWTI